MLSNVTTTAEIDEVSLELISSIVQTELIQSAVLAPTVTDYSSFASQGAKSAKIPSTGSFLVQKKQAAQAADLQKLSMSGDVIPFDQQAVVQALVEDIASIQSNVPITAEYLRRMASAHGLQFDKDLFAQIKLVLAANNQAYSAGSAPTKADFTKARKIMRDNHVPSDGQWFCLLGSTNEKKIMDLSDFVDADKWLSGSEAIKLNGVLPGGSVGNGFIGKAYGFLVIVSTVLDDAADNGMYFYHSSHAGYAFQQGPRIQEQYKLEYLANLVSMDQLYGMKVLNSGIRGVRIGA